MSRFDDLAQDWDLNPRRVESALKTTAKIKELIDIKDRDILDFGAGTGLVAFGLFEDAKSVTAMDNSQGMLDEIDKKVKIANIKNIKTYLLDAETEKLPKNSYDLVVMAMTLHHIKNPQEFIYDMKSSLRSGGYLAISDLESEDGSFHSMGNDDVEHFGFDKKMIREYFEKAGLEVVYIKTNEIIQKHREFSIFLAIGKNV